MLLVKQHLRTKKEKKMQTKHLQIAYMKKNLKLNNIMIQMKEIMLRIIKKMRELTVGNKQEIKKTHYTNKKKMRNLVAKVNYKKSGVSLLLWNILNVVNNYTKIL